jgi:predicted MPP superfamily phosphohydrolase
MRKLFTRIFRRIPRWVKGLVLFGTGAMLLLLIWGVAIEPRLFEEREEIVHIFDLPPAWEGQQVALIADLQVGMWLGNTDTIRRIVARLVEIRPAAVLIAGDFIYHPLEDEPEDVREDYEPDEFEKETIEEARKVADLLRPLTAAGLPTYAVLGNHDYGIKTRAVQPLPWLADRVQSALEQIGIRVLRNEAIPLHVPRSPGDQPRSPEPDLYLVGIGAHLADQDRPTVALASVPEGAPRLVFMHNPASFLALPAGTAPFAMAGHTHGGQMRTPFFPHWSIWSVIRQKELHMDGWGRDFGQPGNRLYVNRGIGFSAWPIRINCFPELTVFTLRRAF